MQYPPRAPPWQNSSRHYPRIIPDSMRRIGNELPVCLKETGMGGLAVTESAKKIMKKMLNVTEMLKID